MSITSKIGGALRIQGLAFRMNQLKHFSWRNPKNFLKFYAKYFTKKIPYHGFLLNVHGEEIFRVALDVCRKSGLTPFLVWGSLLGYCREGRPIEHDNDIDLAFIDPPEERLQQLMKDCRTQGYHLVLFRRAQSPEAYAGKITVIQHYHPKWKLGFDFYCLYPEGNNVSLFKNWGAENVYYRHSFPKEIFENPKYGIFLNHRVLIPGLPEQFLSRAYGNWKVPVKEEHHKVLNEEIIS